MKTSLDTQSANRRKLEERARDAALYFAFGGLAPQDAVDHIRPKFDLNDMSYEAVVRMVGTRVAYVDLAWRNAETSIVTKLPWYVQLQGHVYVCIETSSATLWASVYRERDEAGYRHRTGDVYLGGLIGVVGQQVFHDKYDALIERVARQLDPPERWP